MDDCITISDDEDIEMVQYVVNLEPIIIDLTDSEESSQEFKSNQQTSSESSESRSAPQSPLDPNQEQQSQHHQEHSSQFLYQNHNQFKSQSRPYTQPAAKSDSQSSYPSQDSAETHSQDQHTGHRFEPQQHPKYTQEHNQHQQTQQNNNKQSQKRPPTPTPTPQPKPKPPPPPEEQSEPGSTRASNLGEHNEQPNQVQNEQHVQDKAPKPSKPPMSDYELMLAQKNLGNQKYKNNLFDDAIRTYKRANELARRLEDKEMSAILHFNLAMTYYRLGSFDQAADECAQAVKINDNYMKAHLKRAEIYQRQRKFDEAVICYEHICQLDSTNQDYAILLNHAKEAAKQTKKKDYYQILGLSTNFTREDLKKAYRQQALNHHPDRHSDADIVTRRIQEKHFKDASEAHSFIQLRLNAR